MFDLPEDVLWYIFNFNSPEHPMFSHFAYRTPLYNHFGDHDTFMSTQHSSQVCKHWRRIILSSPSIWGRLFNLFFLSHCRKPFELIELLLERSNGCDKIYVHGAAESKDGLWYFLELIRLRWTSVAFVHVDIRVQIALTARETWRNYDFMDHPAWTILKDEVSPSLEYFKLSFSGLPQSRIKHRLFINAYNQRVKFLHLHDNLRIPSDTQGPIFHNLRQLILNLDLEQEERWTIHQFFDVLKCASLLEVLCIQRNFIHDIDSSIYTSPYSIGLPHLRYLEVVDTLECCLTVLLYVEPARICNLNLDVSVVVKEFHLLHLATLMRVVCDRYAQCMQFQDILDLCICPGLIYLKRTPLVCCDFLSISFRPINFQFLHLPEIVDLLQNDAFKFEAVSSLRLVQWGLRFEEAISRRMEILLRQFSSVKTLITHSQGFDRFYHWSVGGDHFSLPHIQKIYLDNQIQIPAQSELLWEETDQRLDLQRVLEFCKVHLKTTQEIATCQAKGETLESIDISFLQNSDREILLPSLLQLSGLHIL
ncbi:hypothetical protein CPB83DRAFT_852342 [Crepidotus variabilis]|uniref:F-box domain-containing protein n=1 Tax=Crepidotus variabilis TaxID=179855 RepID=A0A9P6JQF4_9AGAR|nr:hypothetical protein CPB83DRAFT_852342 [Crepidotus variabilis]